MLLKSIILAGAMNGVFIILLLQIKQKKSASDRLLAVWMGLIAVQLFFYYDNLSAKPVLPLPVQLSAFAIPLLSSPVLYFYIKGLALGEILNIKNKAYIALPYLLFVFLCFYLHFSQNALSLINCIPYSDRKISKLWMFVLPGTLAIVPGYYSIAGLFVLVKYQKALPHNYSYTENINLNWLKWMVIVLIAIFLGLFIIIKFGVNLGWIEYENLFSIVGAVLTLYVFFIGFLGFRQHNFSGNQPQPIEEDLTIPGYKNSGLNEIRAKELFEVLSKHMQEQQPYLDDTLNLRALAAQLSITPNQLSQVINQQAGANFFTFVNQYRVEAARLKLLDPAMAHYSILSIAFDCGFSSKSTFNKIFKETTGLTPMAYQKTLAK